MVGHPSTWRRSQDAQGIKVMSQSRLGSVLPPSVQCKPSVSSVCRELRKYGIPWVHDPSGAARRLTARRSLRENPDSEKFLAQSWRCFFFLHYLFFLCGEERRPWHLEPDPLRLEYEFFRNVNRCSIYCRKNVFLNKWARRSALHEVFYNNWFRLYGGCALWRRWIYAVLQRVE